MWILTTDALHFICAELLISLSRECCGHPSSSVPGTRRNAKTTPNTRDRRSKWSAPGQLSAERSNRYHNEFMTEEGRCDRFSVVLKFAHAEHFYATCRMLMWRTFQAKNALRIRGARHCSLHIKGRRTQPGDNKPWIGVFSNVPTAGFGKTGTSHMFEVYWCRLSNTR